MSVALLAFWLAAPKVASTTSLAVLLSCAYAILVLGWVPAAGRVLQMRLQAVVAVVATAVLDVVITGARAIARSAWSYESFLVWYDEASNSVCKLPLDDRGRSAAADRLVRAI